MQLALGRTLAILVPLWWLVLLTPPAALPASQTDQCGGQSSGKQPNPSRDDMTNCIVEQLNLSRIRVSVSYTNFSRRGNANTWLGADVLASGTRLKWFGYRPAQLVDSGKATVEIIFGVESPPSDRATTDQVELFMFVGKGEIFYRKAFNLNHEWKL